MAKEKEIMHSDADRFGLLPFGLVERDFLVSDESLKQIFACKTEIEDDREYFEWCCSFCIVDIGPPK